MPWVESTSASFRARHDAGHTPEALRLLNALEATRARMAQHFPRPVEGMTVVVHTSMASLLMARPMIAVSWLATAPAARRYLAGSGGPRELHVLSFDALAERASAVAGSRQMLARGACALYARRVVVVNNRDLQSALRPARPALAVRWAWLLEGAARWFAGQTEYARPAIARRLREGSPPRFPPAARDASLLGGTVIDLLAREEGRAAAARFACRLHRGGPQGALVEAFGGRPLVHTEGAWRAHLARMAGAP